MGTLPNLFITGPVTLFHLFLLNNSLGRVSHCWGASLAQWLAHRIGNQKVRGLTADHKRGIVCILD